MFDTAKVQQMTTALEKFAREHEDIYVFPEWLTPEVFALFRRMRITIRAVVFNAPPPFPQKEIFGCPVMVLPDAIKNFTPRTGIVFLSAKPQSNPLNIATFTLGNQQLNVPIFSLTSDEALAIYDRLTLIRTLQQYQEDGVFVQPKDLATHFARGLTTFLDPRFQYFKFQLWDSREYFKPRYDFDDTAIVIQGPIAYANNYTAETFKFYRSIYPNVPIVVSTWQGEATDTFRLECKNNSVVLLENEMPDPQGPWHINCHLKSSSQGIKYVQENTSAKFVLKIRSDQRMNQMDCLVYLKNLLETFPPNGSKLQRRIVFPNSTASKSIPFYFYDYFSFGHLLDISRLYGIPFPDNSSDIIYTMRHSRRFGKVQELLTNNLCPVDYNFANKQNRKLRNLNKMFRRLAIPEIYISRTFYNKYITPIDDSKFLETGWKFTRDYTILIDYNVILLDWCKYESRRYDLMDSYVGGQLAFARWLDLYRNFNVD